MQDSMMLDRAGNNVIPTSALGVGDSFDGEIVGFTSTTSEDDFSWPDAKRSRDRFASIIDRFKANPAESVDAAWVTEALSKIWEHALDDSWVNRCCRCVIEIDNAIRERHRHHLLWSSMSPAPG